MRIRKTEDWMRSGPPAISLLIVFVLTLIPSAGLAAVMRFAGLPWVARAAVDAALVVAGALSGSTLTGALGVFAALYGLLIDVAVLFSLRSTGS